MPDKVIDPHLHFIDERFIAIRCFSKAVLRSKHWSATMQRCRAAIFPIICKRHRRISCG